MKRRTNVKQPIPKRTIMDFIPTPPTVREGRAIGETCYVLAHREFSSFTGKYCGERFIPMNGNRIMVKTSAGMHFVDEQYVSFSGEITKE